MKKLKLIKSLLIVLTGGGILLAACSQALNDSKVPMVVKTSFATDFPGNSPKWDKENSNYEANFKTDGNRMSALYNKNGKLQETETDISIAVLPTSVQGYIAKNYPGKKVKEAATITKASGEVNYEAEVNDADVLLPGREIYKNPKRLGTLSF